MDDNANPPGRRAGAEENASFPPARRRGMRRTSSDWFWNETHEEKFFEVLASCANVSWAAKAAGFATPTVYRLRMKRPDFAARWQEALDQGYARLELAFLEASIDTMRGKPIDAERPIPRMTVDQAMNVLHAHRNEVRGNGRRGPGRRARPRPLAEVHDSILRKIEAIEKAGGEKGRAGDAA